MSSSATSDGTEVFQLLDGPMFVVTTEDAGCLVGFTTQCSIRPPRFLACISKVNHTHDAALHADQLTVHALDVDDRHLAEGFGELTGDAVDKLALVDLEGAAAWFDARVVDRLDLGDHTGFLLEPIAGAVRRWGGQLGYQAVKDLDPGHPA